MLKLPTHSGFHDLFLKYILVLPIFSALTKMAAVEEQQKKFTKFATGFAKRLAHHLNNLFIHQVSKKKYVHLHSHFLFKFASNLTCAPVSNTI